MFVFASSRFSKFLPKIGDREGLGPNGMAALHCGIYVICLLNMICAAFAIQEMQILFSFDTLLCMRAL